MTPLAPQADRIDALLPQTQCTRCGYPACRPYADAIATGDAEINRCPPGREATVVALAALLGRGTLPLDTARGMGGPLQRAVIDANACIGCTLCIDACPVDAIVGAQKRLHGVLSLLCSGCELCVAPCPVDCISMVDAGRDWTTADADAARERHDAREQRRSNARARSARSAERRTRTLAVAAALARARARRAPASP